MLFEAGKRVLFIAPHADDELFSAGGTLLRMHEAHMPIFPVLATTGSVTLRFSGEAVAGVTRREEFYKACKWFTDEEPQVLLPEALASNDGRLDTVPQWELINRLDGILEAVQPQIIFVPFASEHQDHIAVSKACAAMLRPTARFLPERVMIYDPAISRPLLLERFIPTFYVNIEKWLEKKVEILREVYKSQFSEQARGIYSEKGMRELARYRGFEAGMELAEGFRFAFGREP